MNTISNDSEYVINKKAARLLEEIVESLDGSIVKQLPEDCELITQAYDDVNGQMLSEKYKQLVEDVKKLSENIVYQIERIDAANKRNVIS